MIEIEKVANGYVVRGIQTFVFEKLEDALAKAKELLTSNGGK